MKKALTTTEMIKKAYLAGDLNSVDALRDLEKAGYWPKAAQQIVEDLIKEKSQPDEELAMQDAEALRTAGDELAAAVELLPPLAQGGALPKWAKG